MGIQDVLELDKSIWRYRWKVKVCDKKPVGSLAGTLSKRYGYILIRYKGKDYRAHRLIYEQLVGPIPKGMEVDHINRIRDDNRIDNLRLCTQSEQMYNRTLSKKPKTGYKGISVYKNKARRTKYYLVRIRANNALNSRKYFPYTQAGLNLAVAYATDMRKQLHGKFANHE